MYAYASVNRKSRTARDEAISHVCCTRRGRGRAIPPLSCANVRLRCSRRLIGVLPALTWPNVLCAGGIACGTKLVECIDGHVLTFDVARCNIALERPEQHPREVTTHEHEQASRWIRRSAQAAVRTLAGVARLAGQASHSAHTGGRRAHIPDQAGRDRMAREPADSDRARRMAPASPAGCAAQ